MNPKHGNFPPITDIRRETWKTDDLNERLKGKKMKKITITEILSPYLIGKKIICYDNYEGIVTKIECDGNIDGDWLTLFLSGGQTITIDFSTEIIIED